MTRQVLDLSGLTGEGWRDAVLVDPALVDGGATAYLRHIRRIGNSLQIRLAASDSADPQDAGPEFTEAFELSARAFTFASDAGGTVTLKGPTHGDNDFDDPTEPYFWTPDNGAAMGRWFGATMGDFTLTLDDGIAIHALRGRAEAGAEARASVARVTPPVRDIAGRVEAGAAGAGARVAVLGELVLADFDTAGLEIDVLALIEAGAGNGGDTLYEPAPIGGVGSLLDGELGLGSNEATINRIRRRSGDRSLDIRVPAGTLDPSIYFGTGGAGRDLNLYIQTRGELQRRPARRFEAAGTSSIQFGQYPASFATLMGSIGAGERFIFALARFVRHALSGTAQAGGAQARAGVNVLPALTLDDFDARGLDVETLALIRAGAGATLYATPPHGNAGALVAGELGIGPDEAAITRLRRRGGNMLVVNDDDLLVLSEYFGAGGAGASLTLYVQTHDGIASLPATERGTAGTSFIQFGPIGSALDAILDGIGAGDLFIFALARTAHEVSGRAEAGGAQARAAITRVTPAVRSTGGRAEAGGAQARTRAERLPALTLDDFESDGLTIEALALLRSGEGFGFTLYAAADPIDSIGSLLDGELGIGPDQVPITRIRRRLDRRRLNIEHEDAAFDLGAYFGRGGDGRVLTVYLQTAAGLAMGRASRQASSGRAFVEFGPFGAAFETLLNSIGDNERFIFAFARGNGASYVQGRAAAGGALVRATVRPIVHRLVRGRATSGEAETRARIAVVPPHEVRGRAEAGTPETRAHIARVPPHEVRGRAAAGQAEARARLRPVVHRLLRGRATSGGAVARARVRRVPPATEQYARTLRQSAPERGLLVALEIRHPAIARPVRVINDTVERVIEGNRFVPLRFDARLADGVDGQAPQAELAIDNVGREITQWVEATGGGIGAMVRFMQIIDIDDPPVEWELTMDVAGMEVDSERIVAKLGFAPLLGRAAVTLRHDPQTSPGLF